MAEPEKYCIIGAGAAGITAAKNLLEHDIPFDVIEREDDVGGNWVFGKPNSGVYASTHLISSSKLSGYVDYPMPDQPDYPRHNQVLAYLRGYARHFGVYEHIQFNTTVQHCERDDDGLWRVTLDNGETRRYRGLLICNGHLSKPFTPDYPGSFDGEMIHSQQYKTPEILRGKRVLVVGAGNSGCDLAVEAVHHAQTVFHSTRRGYYYIPKYVFGVPSDQFDALAQRIWSPRWLRRWVRTFIVKMVLGHPADYGLPAPDHRLLETHPIVNSQMLYHVGHGDIIAKPNIAELRGDRVAFDDGSEEAIDLIVYATGYQIAFPFIDNAHLNWADGRPNLYMHFLHPAYDNLFVIGMIQPDSGVFWLMDLQAQVVARYIQAQTQAHELADQLRQIKAGPQPDIRGGVHHIDSTRHILEIDHISYRKALYNLLKYLSKERTFTS